jgi:hypothetical protein
MYLLSGALLFFRLSGDRLRHRVLKQIKITKVFERFLGLSSRSSGSLRCFSASVNYQDRFQSLDHIRSRSSQASFVPTLGFAA